MNRYSCCCNSGMVEDESGNWVRVDDVSELIKRPATVIICGDPAKARELAKQMDPKIDNVQIIEIMEPNTLEAVPVFDAGPCYVQFTKNKKKGPRA